MPVREAECRCKFPETHGGVILMKKILALMLLTLGALALTAPTALAQATQKKEIKDQAEYNAYVAAIQATDINAKISGLKRFRKPIRIALCGKTGWKLSCR